MINLLNYIIKITLTTTYNLGLALLCIASMEKSFDISTHKHFYYLDHGVDGNAHVCGWDCLCMRVQSQGSTLSPLSTALLPSYKHPSLEKKQNKQPPTKPLLSNVNPSTDSKELKYLIAQLFHDHTINLYQENRPFLI